MGGHPFSVVARFEKVVAVSFAFPETVLRPLVPAGLEIDSYEGWGFVTVAMVWTKGLRPAVFPRWMGQDFFLAGYRIFTRLHDADGRSLRGLKIIRSETDSNRMVWSGNLLTKYNYRKVNVTIEESELETRVRCVLPTGDATMDLTISVPAKGAEVALPEGSPFVNWRTARQFAGPMPFTFSDIGDGSFLVIQGSRNSWKPRPVEVTRWKVGLFDEWPLQGATPVLANAFIVRDVVYRWEKGRRVRPKGGR